MPIFTYNRTADIARGIIVAVITLLFSACGQEAPQSQPSDDLSRKEGAGAIVAPNVTAEKPEIDGRGQTKGDFSRYISGKRIDKLTSAQSNPFFEIFHRDGTWEGQFAQSDINYYRGKWYVKKDIKLELICVEIELYNKSEITPKVICRESITPSKQGRLSIAHLFEKTVYEVSEKYVD